MATDYVLFLHGVSTREKVASPAYADSLYANIVKHSAPSLQLKKIALYWGDVAQVQEEKLKKTYQRSETWPTFWFLNARENLLLQFIGDTVLYISRYVGAQIVEKLKKQIDDGLQGYQSDDRLHLVTHSLGTIILFDVLFSSRWDTPEAPGRDNAEWIRSVIYGVVPSPLQGIRVASVHTMGAPIGLFSLMDVDLSEQNQPGATHDITPRLQVFLQSLAKVREDKPLPWLNFAHPGDPLAYPLDPLLYDIVDGEKRFLTIQDHVASTTGLLDKVLALVKQSMIALVDTANAHNSYWQTEEVAKQIALTISASAQTP
ncbi:MAG: hypothetical protein NVS4B11_36370 [Ktedonobacteraceae bacterium]